MEEMHSVEEGEAQQKVDCSSEREAVHVEKGSGSTVKGLSEIVECKKGKRVKFVDGNTLATDADLRKKILGDEVCTDELISYKSTTGMVAHWRGIIQ